MGKKAYRKMLSDIDAPCLNELMDLISTQSKTTIVNWCLNYAEKYVLPIYEKNVTNDIRPRKAIDSARLWLEGKIKLPTVKADVLECHAAAREAEDNPAAQAAARTIGQVAASIHAPTHSLGLALYGALAIAYDVLGADKPWAELERYAYHEVDKMIEALKAVAVKDEPNKAKINWRC